MTKQAAHRIRSTWLLATTLALLCLPATAARAQGEEGASAAAPEPDSPAAADGAEAPAADTKCPPIEAPKCDCPPPCPAPPPAPPAPPADAVEWKAQSNGGLMTSGGNSQSRNFSLGVLASRKQGNNRLTIEGGLAYGTNNNVTMGATHADAGGQIVIDSVERQRVVNTNNWASKARYDRFITDNNTAYASGQAAGDRIAGKTFFGGAQAGYSRQLVKDAWNIVVAELGYDFSYERYVSQPDKATDPVSIHSARILVGEMLTLTKETGITASVEALFNLNKETRAIKYKSGELGVGAFKDTRINGKVGLSTNLYRALSFGFGFAIKYDQNPAPRPVPKGAPTGASFDPQSSVAYADRVDTLTEATLIYTFF